MPASLHARAIRTAISPRLAIRTLRTAAFPSQWVTIRSLGLRAGSGPMMRTWFAPLVRRPAGDSVPFGRHFSPSQGGCVLEGRGLGLTRTRYNATAMGGLDERRRLLGRPQ